MKKVMTQPISVIFRMLQVRSFPLSAPFCVCGRSTHAFTSPIHSQGKQRLQVWLYEQTQTRMEGKLIGFDEYMNVVLDDAEEVDLKKGTRKSLGRILLKGDAITLIQHVKA